jgi:hypothetical protein
MSVDILDGEQLVDIQLAIVTLYQLYQIAMCVMAVPVHGAQDPGAVVTCTTPQVKAP